MAQLSRIFISQNFYAALQYYFFWGEGERPPTFTGSRASVVALDLLIVHFFWRTTVSPIKNSHVKLYSTSLLDFLSRSILDDGFHEIVNLPLCRSDSEKHLITKWTRLSMERPENSNMRHAKSQICRQLNQMLRKWIVLAKRCSLVVIFVWQHFSLCDLLGVVLTGHVK